MKSTVICSVLALVFFAATIAQAEVIYIEGFGSGSSTSAASEGWSAWRGATATDASSSADEPIYLFVGTDNDGRYAIARTSALPALFATTEVGGGSVATADLESVSFLANHSTSTQVRVVAQIDGGNWYATSEAFTMLQNGDAYNWTEKAELKTFNWSNAASAWQELNFTPGSTLALGSAASSDLSGNVTQFGFLITGSDARIDTFTVTAVPEPGSVALGFVGLACLLAWPCLRRRSTNS